MPRLALFEEDVGGNNYPPIGVAAKSMNCALNRYEEVLLVILMVAGPHESGSLVGIRMLTCWDDGCSKVEHLNKNNN